MSNNSGEILDAIKAIEEKYNIEHSNIITMLNKDLDNQIEQDTHIMVEAHKILVGLCFRKEEKSDMFPSMYRYYKIISERAFDSNQVSALIFYEHPTYWFDYKKKGYYLGEFDFESIIVDSIDISCFNEMEQISSAKYSNTMWKYVTELTRLSWYADHYRFGGKLPTDENWPIRR